MHKFCANELKNYILANIHKEIIECPLCLGIPPEERKFDDPEPEKVENPDSIEIDPFVVQGVLSVEDYDKYLDIKAKGWKPDIQENEFLFVCNGFLKKNQTGKNKFIEKEHVN